MLHLDACAVYKLPGELRKIYFRPSAAVKDALPYTPGERQAKVAVIPQPRKPLPEVDYVLQRIQSEYMAMKRQGEDTIADDLFHAWDSLEKVKDRL